MKRLFSSMPVTLIAGIGSVFAALFEANRDVVLGWTLMGICVDEPLIIILHLSRMEKLER